MIHTLLQYCCQIFRILNDEMSRNIWHSRPYIINYFSLFCQVYCRKIVLWHRDCDWNLCRLEVKAVLRYKSTSWHSGRQGFPPHPSPRHRPIKGFKFNVAFHQTYAMMVFGLILNYVILLTKCQDICKTSCKSWYRWYGAVTDMLTFFLAYIDLA